MGLATLESHGHTIPDDVMAAARAADGLIVGPVDTYAYPPAEQGGVNPSAALRVGLDLFANIRPSRIRDGVPAMASKMDLVIVRENTEGFYADRNMFAGSGEFQPSEDLALSVRKVSVKASRRIVRSAFELAMGRRRKVTVVHKANVLRLTDGLFLKTFREVAAEFPEVTWDEAIIDAMAALLIRDPAAFDVVVTTNMYGDILSDEAAELAGGLGLAPSINAGEHHAMAQAVHGSAPDLAGRGIANPTALMGSAAMLLHWLAARHGREDLGAAGGHLIAALDRVLGDPANHTRDLGGAVDTATFGRLVAAAIDGDRLP